MLFYTTIFLASLFALLVARLLYKAVSLLYKAVSKSGRSAHVSNRRVAITSSASGHQKKAVVRKAAFGNLIPVDRNGHVKAWNQAGTNAALPNVNRTQDTAWLLREKKLVSAGNAYKVKRRVVPATPTLDMVSKPWRRKVAPWILNPEWASEPCGAEVIANTLNLETVDTRRDC